MNTKKLLREILDKLSESNIICWVFGGWAEELKGLSKAKNHKDIDLLYYGNDFNKVDDFLSNNQFIEIKEKRFTHKRAFLVDDIVVELFLVQQKDGQMITNFFGATQFIWPKNTLGKRKIDGFLVTSSKALINYRTNWSVIHCPSTKF